MKYPIASKETGNTYEVKITPYVSGYSEGCFVYLNKKHFHIFSQGLYNRMFENIGGKIGISHWSIDEVTQTEIDYNLINMASLIVNLYESKNKKQSFGQKKLNNDYEAFCKWNGEV